MEKNKIKALLLSAGSVGIAVLLLGYSAYGWMTMSRNVTATGMNLKITVPENLQISVTSATEDFSSALTFSFDDIVKKYDNRYTEDKTFALLPASTYDGRSVWKTDNANYDGSAKADTVFEDVSAPLWHVQYRDETKAFEGYYIDVPIWLRTAAGAPQNIGISENDTKFIYVDGSGNEAVTQVARMAFLSDDKTHSADGSENPLIFAEPRAENSPGFRQVVTGAEDSFRDAAVLTYTDNISEQKVCTLEGADYSDSVMTYHPYALVVRIWIEGQDPACVAAIGQSKFNVDISFIIKNQ